MGWSYVRHGSVQDEVVGPVEWQDLLEPFQRGELKAGSQVMHPSGTKGRWVLLNTLPGYVKFQEAVRDAQAQQREADRLRKADVAAEAAEQRRAAAAKRAEQDALERAQEQQRQAVLSKQREQDGSDRWPHLVRYATFVDMWGIVVQVVVTLALVLPALALAALVGIGMLVAGDPIMLLIAILMVVFWIAVAVLVGYWFRLVLGAMADFLKCHAAIEANTRRLWSEGRSR